jgi:hypothetical protein
MSSSERRPVLFFAFANDRGAGSGAGYLRNLPEEARRLRKALERAERAGLCEAVVRQNATAADVLDVFQDERYRDQVAVFHYGGHADGYRLLLESAAGEPAAARAGGLAAFLGLQRTLTLVFLNGCSTGPQVQGLLDAGVPTVVATASAIEDAAATEFAGRFYAALGNGATVRRAFDEAAAAVTISRTGATRDLLGGGTTELDVLPWHLLVGEGAEVAAEWSLPKAAGDPLFGLPTLPPGDLPENPYLEPLAWYGSDHAEVFFGRGYQVRELFDRVTDPGAPPIILLFGRSGVGKSSLLAAGLQPRLAVAGYASRYVRRDPLRGLAATLCDALAPPGTATPPGDAWRDTEKALGRPLVVIVDQVDESLTHGSIDRPGELDEFFEALSTVFLKPGSRPQGKLVLGFRMEWLAVIERRLAAAHLPRAKVFLEPLDRRGIIEAVRGPGRLTAPGEVERPILARHLADAYGLEIDEDLPGRIADDLLNDRDAHIAPTLQILLSAMWEKARAAEPAQPRFDCDLYEGLRRKGILLGDFLDRQLAALRAWRPDAVDSGLVLDLLAYHTSPFGSTAERDGEELKHDYSHTGPELPELLQRAKDLYLLAEPGRGGEAAPARTRLAHDTLAPLVRERFDRSDRPAQRAWRVLRNRLPDWERGLVGSPLEGHDLEVVERAERSMRAWSDDERRLLEASRQARKRDVRDRCRLHAESLLRALGHEPGPIGRVELATLWGLACLPADLEGVRTEVLRRGLEEPGTARQMANRLAPVVHGAVGLSAARRREVVSAVVLPGLRARWADPQVAWTCARVGIVLGANDEEFLSLASEALAACTAARGLPGDEEWLTLAPQLPAAAADRIAGRLVSELTRDAEAVGLKRLTEALVAVGPRLSPDAATRSGSLVVEVMRRTRRSGELLCLARAAASLGSAPASDGAAGRLIDVMANTGDLDDLCRLAEGLDAVRPGGAPVASVRAVGVPTSTLGLFEIVRVARTLEDVGPRLLPADAYRTTDRLVAALSQLTVGRALETVSRGLEIVVPRLSAQAAGKAAEQFVSGLARTHGAAAMPALTRALRAVAGRLPAAEARRQVEPAAHCLFAALAEAHDPENLRCLGQALGVLGPLLSAETVEVRLSALTTFRTPLEMLRLALAVAALGPRLEKAEAGRVAARLADRIFEAIAADDEPTSLRLLAEALAAVVPGLASPATTRAGGRLTELLKTIGDGAALKHLTDALTAIPGYLDTAAALDLLKAPLCVGPARSSLLGAIERLTGKEFGDDVWRLVEQAAALGLSDEDLTRPPVRGPRLGG